MLPINAAVKSGDEQAVVGRFAVLKGREKNSGMMTILVAFVFGGLVSFMIMKPRGRHRRYILVPDTTVGV